jgi:hypothetical protein
VSVFLCRLTGGASDVFGHMLLKSNKKISHTLQLRKVWEI